MTRRPPLLFVNQHYWPDLSATSQHLTDLAEGLAERGWDVRVLCGAGDYRAGSLGAARRERRRGVEIRRVRSTSLGRTTLWRRAVDYVSFFACALVHLLRTGRERRVVFLTTPSLLAFTGWLVRRVRRLRYAVWVMDLHPEVERTLGIFQEGRPFTRLLEWMSARARRGADFLVALGPRMRERLVDGGVDDDAVREIPIWGADAGVQPVAGAANPLVEELGLRDAFVVEYSGNAGLGHRFAEVLEAARRLRDHPTIRFLFIGGGPRRPEIEGFVEHHGLDNVRYLDYFPRERLSESLSLGSVHLVTLEPAFTGLLVPSKTPGIMAAGRPILFVGPPESETGLTVREAGSGVVVDPREEGATDHVVRQLRAWAEEPASARAMGRRARERFLAGGGARGGVDAWERLLLEAWSRSAAPPDGA